MKTRRAPSRHGRDARVCGNTTTAMHGMSTPPCVATKTQGMRRYIFSGECAHHYKYHHDHHAARVVSIGSLRLHVLTQPLPTPPSQVASCSNRQYVWTFLPQKSSFYERGSTLKNAFYDRGSTFWSTYCRLMRASHMRKLPNHRIVCFLQHSPFVTDTGRGVCSLGLSVAFFRTYSSSGGEGAF